MSSTSTSASEAVERAPLTGLYYDGKTSRARRVTLQLQGAALLVRALDEGDSDRVVDARALDVSEPLGAAPRLLGLPGGGHVEVANGVALDALLAALGRKDALHVRAAFSARGVLFALAAFALVLTAAWRWAVPWGADRLAEHIPVAWTEAISAPVLKTLDEQTFAPSKLSPARQEALRRQVQAWQWPPMAQTLKLHFRASPHIGANALALPSGDVIVTDELVQLASGKDELVLAVLAHEIGHVNERHGLRVLLRSVAVSAFFAWWIGDVSSVAAAAPALLAQASYSREMETKADAFAAQALRANGRSPALLADMLERLSQSRGVSIDTQGDAGAAASKEDDRSLRDYFSSHPMSAERIARLRAM